MDAIASDVEDDDLIRDRPPFEIRASGWIPQRLKESQADWRRVKYGDKSLLKMRLPADHRVVSSAKGHKKALIISNQFRRTDTARELLGTARHNLEVRTA
jgi:hypothetical protein